MYLVQGNEDQAMIFDDIHPENDKDDIHPENDKGMVKISSFSDSNCTPFLAYPLFSLFSVPPVPTSAWYLAFYDQKGLCPGARSCWATRTLFDRVRTCIENIHQKDEYGCAGHPQRQAAPKTDK